MSTLDFTTTLDLVRKAQDGDRSAFERLFERYYERVLRVVRIRLGQGVRRDLDSGDILNDAFMVAIRKFDDFEMRDEASFLNWLRTIVENKIKEGAKRQSAARRDRAREVPLEPPGSDEDTPERDLPAREPQPLESLESQEGRVLVDECVSVLPPESREIVLLRDYEGHRWARIADIIGLRTESAARMRHKSALVELGKAIRRRRKGET